MADNPKVFISYSHDSPEHKHWVSELAAQLRRNGIDAILDQWDLGPGDDITLFMEHGIKDSDRVLVICTDKYVSKANANEGGVGYERMIVNAELVQNLGTDKFIPIIRQASGKEKTPTFLGTRVYADFTDNSQFDAECEKLIREIHEMPIVQKPPLGKNPFPSVELDMQLTEIPEDVESASEAYAVASKIIRTEDEFGWQQFIKRIRPSVFKSLVQWRQNELDGTEPECKEQLFRVVDKAVEIVSPLMSIAFIGIESGREEFRDQKSLLDDLRNITGWEPSGHEAWRRIPDILSYIYHSLHGAVSLNTSQLDLVIRLLRIKIPARGSTRLYFDLWEFYQLRSLALSISDKLTDDDAVESKLQSWNYLYTAYERWEWLRIIFENELEYQISLIAYYIALHIHELADLIDRGHQADLKSLSSTFYTIPLPFLSEKWDIISRAISILSRDQESLMKLWECVNITSQQIQNVWEEWIELSKTALEGFGNQFYDHNLDYYLSKIFLYLFEDWQST